MATLTTRELRVIGDIMERLNKARAANEEMGIPTTPDAFTGLFPNGFTAVLRWVEGTHSDDPKRQRTLELSARSRNGYQLDLGAPPDLANALTLRDPQKAKRQRGEANASPVANVDEVVRASLARTQAQRDRLGIE